MIRIDGAENGDAGNRDQAGRFASGNRGGPGRPRRVTERAYLAAISEACPPDVWQEIVAQAVQDAKAGDAKARDWLAAYLVGRPDAAAVTLHRLAVEDEAGTDAVAAEASLASLLSF